MFYKNLFFYSLLLFTFLNFSCTNLPLNTQLDPSWKMPDPSEYKKVIKKKTVNKKKYNGFYNQFDVSMTSLNQDILIKQLKIEANFSQWTAEDADRERSKLVKTMSEDSTFFVSAYTPKADLNNFTVKDVGWTANLVFDGKKYPGKFTASNKTFKLQQFYEHHSPWSKGYILTFKIPVTETENRPQTVVLTSPYGFAKYEFN